MTDFDLRNDPFSGAMLPDIKRMAEAIELVRLGKDRACMQIWDAVNTLEFVKVCEYGKVVRLEDLYRVIFGVVK